MKKKTIARFLWLCLVLTGTAAMGQTVINSNAAPVSSAVSGGSFEAPVTATFVYNPVGTSWTYSPQSGVAKNGSGFTAGNPNTAFGTQVLFLQISGSASTTINFATAGYYRFACKAAKRANGGGNQAFAVLVDATFVDTIRPGNTSYLQYRTTAVYVTAGNHTLTLQGLSPGMDNTAFVDDLNMEKLANWNNMASWSGGVGIPNSTSQRAVIDANEVMVLDADITVKSVDVRGQLIAARDKNLALTTDWIIADSAVGVIDWGTATSPYTRNATITLTGANTGTQVNNWGMGEKFLGARLGGTIDMHGINKTSWTLLNATANPGATSITLRDPANNWNIGDQFVIASTDFRPDLAEVRTVTSISPDKRTIGFSGGLAYMHYGATHTYNGSLVLDERAEVGLLTRNIRIVGNNPGASGFGGHCMFITGSKVRFSGVEFNNMGQKAIKGRYPFHFHELGNIAGQYIRNSSINVSFNRAVAVHTSTNGLIEDNVAYDHIGHGFYLEDDGAVRNVFRHNLGLLTRRPLPAEAIEPHDTVTGNNGLYNTPSTFWINNANNDYFDNAAAGSQGSGFWFLGKNNQTMGAFNDNRGHSNTFNFTIDGNLDANGNLGYGHFHAAAGTTPTINRMASFKARDRGLWTRADLVVFDNCRLADCPRNTFFAYNQQLRNSLIVGKSPNTGTIVTANESAAGRSLALPNKVATDEFNIFYGHSLYDGPSGISNIHFAGFNGNNSFVFSIFAAAQKSTVHWAEGVSFEAGTPEDNKLFFDKSTDAEMMYSTGFIDRDGTISGTVNAVITPRILPHPIAPKIHEDGFNRRPGATLRGDWGAYISTGAPFRQLKMDDYTFNTPLNRYTTYAQYNIRGDGPATFGRPTDYEPTVPSWHQNPVIANDNLYKYYWQRHKIPNRTQAVLYFANLNDYVISVFPNMPSSANVYGTNVNGALLTRVNTLNALQNSGSQAWFLADNTLYVKHIATVATGAHSVTPFGHDMKSTAVNICLLPNCATQTGELDQVVFADLEQGADSRFALTKTGALAPITLQYDAGASPTDATDNKVRWVINKVADAFNDSVDVKVTFSRQVWQEFNHLRFNLTGSSFQVIVQDADQGFLSLGTFAPGAAVIVPLNSAANSHYVDKVVSLTIRIKESDFLAASATVNLFHIALSVNSTSAKTSGAALEPEIVSAAPKGVSVYPNPASRELRVSTHFEQADRVELQLVNAMGTAVYTQQQRVQAGAWNYTLRLPVLPAGVYTLQLKTGQHEIRSSKVTIVQ